MQMHALDEIKPLLRDVALDIRHLVICPPAIRLQQCPAYRAARALVIEELAAANEGRVVLLSSRSQELAGAPLDVPVDVLPVFSIAPGHPVRINREVLSWLFASIAARTVFRIHYCRHPLLPWIVRVLRARGICTTPVAGD